MTDRSNRTTLFEYDTEIDRISKITFPTGGFINTDSDATGSVVSIADDKSNQTTYEYDSDGNLTSITNALGYSTTYEYDASGNQISMTDARNNTTEYEYDGKGRKTKTIFPDGTFIFTAYDHRDNKISETDQAGHTTYFEYDALDRLVKVTDALLNETIYAYDEVGNKISQIDANGHTTQWEYDNLGRVTKRILPLGQEETFTYDAARNVLTHTDFNDNTITFEYDENNRLEKKIFPDFSEEVYGYTETGRQDTVVDARGTTINLYDSGNRLIKVIHPDGSEIEYQYDTMGNKTALIINDSLPANPVRRDTTRYTYDQLNRLKTVTNPDDGVTTYTYDEVGNRQSVNYPNGTKAEYTYDELNRLKKLFNHKSNGDTVSCYEYSLGPSGNRTQVLEHTGRLVQYTYDDTYKLTEEKINDPNFGLRTIGYTYDPVGNRLTKTDDSEVTTYSYDANDRLLTEDHVPGTVYYSYDSNGNTTQKIEGLDTTAYSYDYQNRLIEVITNTDTIEYTYDTDGVRMQKVVNGDVTNYLVDKNRDYAQVLEERDGIGTVLVEYNYGDDLISQKCGSSLIYYHYDGQMSTRQLTDATQLITDTYTYDAFGLLLNRSGATENNYMYTGEQYDPNVGFYYLRARYMNPETGCFLTMDEFPGLMFETYTLHKYLYCGGNPVNRWDPSGFVNPWVMVGIATWLSFWILHTIGVMLDLMIEWLITKKVPVIWTGDFKFNSYAMGLPPNSEKNILSGGIYIIDAHFEGSRSFNGHFEKGMGNYKIITIGLSIGSFASELQGNATVLSPGLLGANPKNLTGPVSFGSVGSYVTDGEEGMGTTLITMGYGHAECTDSYGYDITLASYASGWSFLSGPSYYYCPF